MSALLGGVDSAGGMLSSGSRFDLSLMDNPRLSRSLLLGLLVFSLVPGDGSHRALREIAELAGMGASTTHRYMITLVAVGLVEQHPHTRHYTRVVAGVDRG